MFHSVYLRLTAFYVAVIFAISLFFSAMYYQTSVRELNRGLEGQVTSIRRAQPGVFVLQSGDVVQLIQEQIDASKKRIRWQLIYLNGLILVAGAGASYLLARHTLEPIQEAMEEQARFTADASHELRTPLTAMRAETEVTLGDPKASAKELREQLESNLEEVDKLERLSSALLSLSRHDGETKVTFEPVPVQEIWKEAERRLAPKIAERGAEVVLPANELEVRGQRDMLTELMVILLDNALKYGKEAGRVELSARAEGLVVAIGVRDHGHGIRASDLPHIFDRFYRADRSRHTEGHGLGLSIARRIVKMHGGRIEVSSKLGSGTTFTVRLPRG